MTAAADHPRSGPYARAFVRAAGLALLFLACAPLHVAARALTGRSGWQRRFLAVAARLAGARVRVTGEPIGPHSLILANHVSWLDILILGGSVDSAFVSKDNLGHGLIHWLADQNATRYVNRDARRAAADQARQVAEALAGAKPLTIFPEGTVGPGDRLLPFRSTLLAAVAPPPPGVEVRPVAIDYGPAATEISWHGQTGRDNVVRLLSRKGVLPVTLRLLPPLPASPDRKQLARDAHAAISAALGLQVASDLAYRAAG